MRNRHWMTVVKRRWSKKEYVREMDVVVGGAGGGCQGEHP